MPEEIRRETTETENVVEDGTLPADRVTAEPATTERVTTDPVTGEVIRRGPAATRVVRESTTGVDSHRVATYTHDPYQARRLRAYRLQQTIYLIFAIIEGLIAIRFVLEVLGANPNAGFAQFIYGVTAVFMAPFVGLFGQPRFGTSTIEWSALVAIVVYALIGWVLAKVAWLGAGETRTAAATRTEHIDTHQEE